MKDLRGFVTRYWTPERRQAVAAGIVGAYAAAYGQRRAQKYVGMFGGSEMLRGNEQVAATGGFAPGQARLGGLWKFVAGLVLGLVLGMTAGMTVGHLQKALLAGVQASMASQAKSAAGATAGPEVQAMTPAIASETVESSQETKR